MERDCRLDACRCVMNYMIVLLHAWAGFQYVANTGVEFVTWTVVCSYLSALSVPTFFIISGYLLFTNFNLDTYPSKLKRRVRRLVVPYLGWNILFVMVYLILGRIVPRLGMRVNSFGLNSISGAVSKVISITVSPIDGPLWFIRAIFLLACFSPMMWMIMRRCRGGFIVSLCAVCCFAGPFTGELNPLRTAIPDYALGSFVVGGVIACKGLDPVIVFHKWKWFVIGLACCLIRAIVMISCKQCGINVPVGVEGVFSALRLLEGAVLLCLVSHIDCGFVKTKVFRFLHEMSFFAYAGHFLFCSIYLHSVAPFLGGSWPGKFTVLIVVFVGCGVLTMACVYRIGRKWFPNVIRIFDGTL